MMVDDIDNLNLKVLVFDTDYYALQSINSYLAWDRRTRVTNLSETLHDMWQYLDETPHAELPDVILFDADHIGYPDVLEENVQKLIRRIPDVVILCTAPQSGQMGQGGAEIVEASANAGARGFLLKQEVRLQIAWAIVYTLDHDFVVTRGVAKLARNKFHPRLFNADVLPPQRHYPELTDRIRQAISLTVIEGMPAHLAAHEMGISLHTIRGYVKEGYRIMESHDRVDYPIDMTPQERAFMRFTAFEEDVPATPESDKPQTDGTHS